MRIFKGRSENGSGAITEWALADAEHVYDYSWPSVSLTSSLDPSNNKKWLSDRSTNLTSVFFCRNEEHKWLKRLSRKRRENTLPTRYNFAEFKNNISSTRWSRATCIFNSSRSRLSSRLVSSPLISSHHISSCSLALFLSPSLPRVSPWKLPLYSLAPEVSSALLIFLTRAAKIDSDVEYLGELKNHPFNTFDTSRESSVDENGI